MEDTLVQSELFEGLLPEHRNLLFAIAKRQSLAKSEYLFMLGDHADRLYVVLQGKVELCFPLSLGGAVRDVAVETIEAGRAFGLSALVRPYRFTLSARAAEKSELAAFDRTELMQVLDANPVAGRAFMGRVAEVQGRRFMTMRALWGRELQRSITGAANAPAKRNG